MFIETRRVEFCWDAYVWTEKLTIPRMTACILRNSATHYMRFLECGNGINRSILPLWIWHPVTLWWSRWVKGPHVEVKLEKFNASRHVRKVFEMQGPEQWSERSMKVPRLVQPLIEGVLIEQIVRFDENNWKNPNVRRFSLQIYRLVTRG